MIAACSNLDWFTVKKVGDDTWHVVPQLKQKKFGFLDDKGQVTEIDCRQHAKLILNSERDTDNSYVIPKYQFEPEVVTTVTRKRGVDGTKDDKFKCTCQLGCKSGLPLCKDLFLVYQFLGIVESESGAEMYLTNEHLLKDTKSHLILDAATEIRLQTVRKSQTAKTCVFKKLIPKEPDLTPHLAVQQIFEKATKEGNKEIQEACLKMVVQLQGMQQPGKPYDIWQNLGRYVPSIEHLNNCTKHGIAKGNRRLQSATQRHHGGPTAIKTAASRKRSNEYKLKNNY